MPKILDPGRQFTDGAAGSFAPVAGGNAYFASPGTTTEKTVYSDASLSTAISQPIALDSEGRLPNPVYGSGSFRVSVYASNDTGTRDGTLVFDEDDVGAPTEVTSATLADLQGLQGNASGDVVILLGRASAGDGAGGLFRWDAADKSTEVAADEVTSGQGDGGVWVAPASDRTGASGAWERVDSSAVNVKWYGAAGDGSTDDTIAIQAAISGVSNLTVNAPSISVNSQGGALLFFPVGTYLVTDTLLYSSGIRFVGTGLGSSIEFGPASSKDLFSPNPDKVSGGVTSRGVSFEDLNVQATNANANYGITNYNSSGSTAFAEWVRCHRVLVSGFQGAGIHLGQNQSASGSTYFNLIDQCQLRQNVINVEIDYWGGPTVINGGYMLPASTSSYQVVNRHNGTTITGTSMDSVTGNLIASIYTEQPIAVYGVRREQASGDAQTPFMLIEYDHTSTESWLGEFLISGCWFSQDGGILAINDYVSTGNDPDVVKNAPRPGINARFGTPTNVSYLIDNANTAKGIYNWSRFGPGTLSYDTSESLLSAGAIKLEANSTASLRSITTTIPGAKAAKFVGHRLYFQFLIKTDSAAADDISVRVQQSGEGDNGQSWENATTVIDGDWRVMTVSRQIKSTTDIQLDAFLPAAASSGESLWLAGVNVWLDGFSAMPEPAEDAEILASAAPTTGTWEAGDRVYNSAPTAGGTIGWVCVTGGSPGTWKTWGAISA